MDTLPEATHCAVSKTKHKLESRKPKTSIQAVQPASSMNKCTTCKGERHALYMCPSYKSMSTGARYSHVWSFNLCFNCLGSGDKTKDCRSISRCKKCSKPHHTTLHRNFPSSNATNFASSTPSPDTSQQDVATSNTIETQLALQPTLQMTSRVILQAPSGKQTIARALLDPGASISLITNQIVQQLQLGKTSQNLLISGAQGSNTVQAHMQWMLISCRYTLKKQLYHCMPR